MVSRSVVKISLLLFGACAGLLATVAEAAELITLRATSLLPKEVQTVLANLGEPITVKLAPGESAEDTIRHHCGGSFTDHYLAQVVEANPKLAPLLQSRAEMRDITLPPCPRVRAKALVEVLQGDDPASLLRRELGAAPDTKLSVCRASSNNIAGPKCETVPAAIAVANQMKWQTNDLDILTPNQKLELPFSSRWTVITLKEDVDVETAIHELREAAAASPTGEDLLRVEKASPLNLIQPLDADDPRLAEGNCSPSEEIPKAWPFDQAAVRDALAAAIDHLKKRNPEEILPTVIRIADTGLTGSPPDFGFSENFLAKNRKECPGDRYRDLDRPPNNYNGDCYGIDPEQGGQIEALKDDPERQHGSQVAHFALGGRQFYNDTADLHRLVKLNFARLFQKALGGSSFFSDPATVVQSFSAKPQRADIINLSIGSPAKNLDLIKEKLEALTNEQQIAVIAAGNDGISLANKSSYPASYASNARIQPVVLVVGAHGPDSRRTLFSNYGSNHVDLLAPGCRLVDPLNTDGNSFIAGTSFAAPLVTFTASLLRTVLTASQQGGVDSIEIKARLHATSRFTTAQEASYTRFGGILDIPAALRVFDDVVRLPNGELVVGRWLEPEGGQSICAVEDSPLEPDWLLRIKPDWLLRIRVEPDAAGGMPRLAVLRRDQDWQYDSKELAACTAASEEGPTLLLDNNERRQFRWRDIAAFIPAYDLNNRRLRLLTLASVASVSEKSPQHAAHYSPQIQDKLVCIQLPGREAWCNRVTQFGDEVAAQGEEHVKGEFFGADAGGGDDGGAGGGAGSETSDACELSPQELQQVQIALKEQGFYDGAVDGQCGKLTYKAIRKFQAARNEQPNGILSRWQRHALYDSGTLNLNAK